MRLPLPSVRLSAIALLSVPIGVLVGPARAQAPQWQPLQALNAPPSRSGFTFSPWSDGRMLLFGGDVGNPSATEWAWDGLAWQSVTTPVPRRQGHAIANYDTSGALLLFGGFDGLLQRSDTWFYSALSGTWSQLAPPASPPPLLNPRMAYDPIDDSMVLTGDGFAASIYRFDNVTWAALPVQVPPGLTSVTTDTVHGGVLLTAQDNMGQPTVYRLVGNTLSAYATPLSSGTPRFATYDGDRGRLVTIEPVAGGFRTEEFDDLGFTSFGTTAIAGAIAAPRIAWDPARHETLAFLQAGPTLQLHRWAPQPTPIAQPYGTPCADPTLRLAMAPGDAAVPGSAHRLEITGQNGSFLTLLEFGFSHTQWGAIPLPFPIPLGPANCLLRIESAIVLVLGLGLPQAKLVNVANSPSLLGTRYFAQAVLFDATGVPDTSNGLEVQVGTPLPENALVEPFSSGAVLDPLVSGARVQLGSLVPGFVGGDGRHGSFDPAFGIQVGPSTYEWNTDNTVIPASATLTGLQYFVTDGRFYFTDFVVPAGVTVRFVGSVPPIVQVRGQVDVQGTIDISGRDLPFAIPSSGLGAGERVSTFNARNSAALTVGQPGSLGGPGGGRGGRGANECANTGPILVGGEVLTNGANGENVRLPAGHAYLAGAPGTGGRGGELTPSTGISPNLPSPQLLANIYLPYFCPGGSGGGFSLAGTSPITPTVPGAVPLILGAFAAPGFAFPLLPYPGFPPPGYSSLTHFTVGGSGGGGGGSHGFGLFGFVTSTERWMAGHAGTGGGGAMALRAGGDVAVGATALLASKGGGGVLINGDDPQTAGNNTLFGVSSPGGGGSGGSFLIQSGGGIAVSGAIDTSGAAGSRVGQIITPQIAATAQAGSGSPGFFRLEGAGGFTFPGTSVPALGPQNTGPLLDRDVRTGARSRWYLPATTALPVYLRYELLAVVNGAPVLYSDDSSVSPLAANDPAGAVVLRFQGAAIDPGTGQPLPGTSGPWRTTLRSGVDSLNRDRAKTLRFDIALDTTGGPVEVRELRIVWR